MTTTEFAVSLQWIYIWIYNGYIRLSVWFAPITQQHGLWQVEPNRSSMFVEFPLLLHSPVALKVQTFRSEESDLQQIVMHYVCVTKIGKVLAE